MGRPLRLDALIRVSQLDGREGEDFRSPTQQREICERWASTNSAEIIAWHEAIDVSGKTMRRSDVDTALARIRAGQTDGVVIAWLDRFSRAPISEAMYVHDEIRKAGGRVVACDMAGIDPSDSTGEFALTMMLGVNRMQWRRIAERWDMSRRDAILAGKAMGGAPFGYRFADPTPRTRGRGVIDSRLIPDEYAGPLVRELFERKAAGATWLELARWLDLTAPKSEGRKWARQTVVDMIRRRTYLGEVHHGEHVRIGAQEPLVSLALWRRAQNEPGRRTPRGTYLLTGIARCAGCGRRMRGALLGRGHKSLSGERLYTCVTPECAARPTIMMKRLDVEVVAQFFAHLDNYRVTPVDDESIAEAREHVATLTGEVERLASVVPTHPSAVAAHQQTLADAERRLGEAEDHLHQLVSSQPVSTDGHTLAADWPGLTLDERREILRAGIDAVLVRKALGRGPGRPTAERVLMLFSGDAPRELRQDARPGRAFGWVWDDDPGSLRAAS